MSKNSNTCLVDKFAFTVEEASTMTGISRSLLFKEIAAGRLIARGLGSRTLILREDLIAYLNGLTPKR